MHAIGWFVQHFQPRIEATYCVTVTQKCLTPFRKLEITVRNNIKKTIYLFAMADFQFSSGRHFLKEKEIWIPKNLIEFCKKMFCPIEANDSKIVAKLTGSCSKISERICALKKRGEHIEQVTG